MDPCEYISSCDFIAERDPEFKYAIPDDIESLTSYKPAGLKFRWLHFPSNDTERVKNCLETLSQPGATQYFTHEVYRDLDKAMLRNLRPAVSLPSEIVPVHARHLERSCQQHVSLTACQGPQYPIVSCHVPYLNWEYYQYLKGNKSKTTPKTLHPRRTLDQFYYSGLQDTTRRNCGQTVSKWTGKVVSANGRSEAHGDSLIVLVDQLWFWVISKELIISFFPSHQSALASETFPKGKPDHVNSLAISERPPAGPAKNCTPVPDYRKVETTNVDEDEILPVPANVNEQATPRPPHKGVHVSITEDPTFKQCEDAYELAALMTKQSLTVIFECENKQSADLLGLYRWAIANKAARQTESFEEFGRSQSDPERGIPDDILELRLTVETADILDELNMLSLVIENQNEVLTSMTKAFSPIKPPRTDQVPSNFSIEQRGGSVVYLTANDTSKVKLLQHDSAVGYITLESSDKAVVGSSKVGGLAGDLIDETTQELRRHMTEISRLKRDAEYVHKALLDVLDLKSKEAALHEARSSVKQGRAVMLFTIVTIIFLPISFFTSYFGQNISELTGDDKNPSAGTLWKVGAPISVVVIVVALCVAIVIAKPKRRILFWRQRSCIEDTACPAKKD